VPGTLEISFKAALEKDGFVSNTQQIIDKFGGQSALARLLGKQQSTVH
jgi:hypothetical protein